MSRQSQAVTTTVPSTPTAEMQHTALHAIHISSAIITAMKHSLVGTSLQLYIPVLMQAHSMQAHSTI